MNYIQTDKGNVNGIKIITSLKGLLMDALFPRRCPVCDRPVDFGKGLVHRECMVRFKTVGEVRCMKCGTPLINDGDEYCPNCRKYKRGFERCFSAFVYNKAMQEAIFKFKYGGRREYAQFFGEVLYRAVERELKEIKPDCLIPVPLHKDKLKKRGFNQAELLAERVGELGNIRVRCDLVERIKHTAPQKELGASDRRKNVKRAFKMTRNDVNYNSIVIVDDIFTTGSTIDEISEVLKRHGNYKIYGLTLATGAPR